jgi:excisionase family DNA binding protein
MPLTAGNSHRYAPDGPSDVIVLDTEKFLGDVREVIREALDGAADTAGRRASLSPSDAATELGLSESVVRKLVNSGELGHRRVGSRILIGQEHIAVFLYGSDHHGVEAS